MRVRVGGRDSQVDSLSRRELAHCIGLVIAVAWSERSSGEDPVDDLAGRSDACVEAEVVGDVLDDLLQARGDDIDTIAVLAVLFQQRNRLGVQQGTEDVLHRLTHDLLQCRDREPAKQSHPVDRSAAGPVDSRQQEQEPPERCTYEVSLSKKPAPAEQRGERERGRPADQRAVEIEEGSTVPLTTRDRRSVGASGICATAIAQIFR